jgi:hypothetical protein
MSEGYTFGFTPWYNQGSSYAETLKAQLSRNPKIAEYLENKLGFTSCISDADSQMLSDCGIKA